MVTFGEVAITTLFGGEVLRVVNPRANVKGRVAHRLAVRTGEAEEALERGKRALCGARPRGIEWRPAPTAPVRSCGKCARLDTTTRPDPAPTRPLPTSRVGEWGSD